MDVKDLISFLKQGAIDAKWINVSSESIIAVIDHITTLQQQLADSKNHAFELWERMRTVENNASSLTQQLADAQSNVLPAMKECEICGDRIYGLRIGHLDNVYAEHIHYHVIKDQLQSAQERLQQKAREADFWKRKLKLAMDIQHYSNELIKHTMTELEAELEARLRGGSE